MFKSLSVSELEWYLQEYQKDNIPSEIESDYDFSSEDNFEEFAKKIGFSETVYLEPSFRENFFNKTEKRISLAYEKLTQIPKSVAIEFADQTFILDLSYNSLRDLSFLTNFKNLHSLILDKNTELDDKSLPFLGSLKLLWLNNCDIKILTKWIRRIRKSCPSINYLSLLGNPGALSTFNGGSILEHNDYVMFVISQLQELTFLDDCAVTKEQRIRSKSHRSAYNLSIKAFNMIDKIGQSNKFISKTLRYEEDYYSTSSTSSASVEF